MKRTAKACLSMFRVHIAEGLQYRMAAMSGVVTSFAWALIEIAIFSAFFLYAERSGSAGGLDLQQTISHVWLREMLMALMPIRIESELRDKIANGDVAIELCRPLDLYWHWFMKCASGRVVGFVFRGMLCFLIGFLVPGGVGAQLPASLQGFLLFMLSSLCAFVLCVAYAMLLVAIRMNITWGDTPITFILLIGNVLSGSYLPLQLWPDFLQPLLLLQPFSGMLDLPARLYIGSMLPTEALEGFGLQLAWTFAFILVGRTIMQKRLRVIVAQGG